MAKTPVNKTVSFLERAARFRKMCTMVATGHDKEYGPEPSQDPIDALLHELFYAQAGARAFSNRVEEIKKRMEAFVNKPENLRYAERIQKLKELAVKEQAKQIAVVAEGQNWRYEMSFSKPAERLDEGQLRIALNKQGWTTEMINNLIDSAKVRNAPAKTHVALYKE